MLEIKELSKKFGELVALDKVSFDVSSSSILGIIGPNGAGKTTLFNVICGFYRPEKGAVLLHGESITGLKPHIIARKGVGRTFQTPRIFRDLTVLQNMLAPMIDRDMHNEAPLGRVKDLLRIVKLTDLTGEMAGNLSIGQQKLLEFARVLMPDPELILLDEPFSGVNPAIKIRIMELIKQINKEKRKTFVIISHDVPAVAETCQRVIVLNRGQIISSGSCQEIREDPKVIDAYLGVL